MANELNTRFNDLFGTDDFFNNFGRSLFDQNRLFKQNLKTDVIEGDKGYKLAIDLPGVSKNDITLDFKDNVLTVSAKRDSFSDESDKDGNLVSSERSYGRFSRQYRLPNVDQDKISAKYEDGVLKIDLPKAGPEVTHQHHIEIA